MSATATSLPFKLRRACVVAGREAKAGEVVDLVELPLHRVQQLEKAGYGLRVQEEVPAEWYERAPRAVAAEPEAEMVVDPNVIPDDGVIDLDADNGFGLGVEAVDAPKTNTAPKKTTGSTRKAPSKPGRKPAKKR